MKSTHVLLALTVLCVSLLVAFRFLDGDARADIMLLLPPVITALVMVIKQDKTIEVGRDNTEKLDRILNGEVKGTIDNLDARVTAIESDIAIIKAAVVKS